MLIIRRANDRADARRSSFLFLNRLPARCRLNNRQIIVRLGEYDFTRRFDGRALDFRVTDVRIHESFEPSTYDNDIALLKIHRPTAFTNYIWPICLPPVGRTFENKSAIVIGKSPINEVPIGPLNEASLCRLLDRCFPTRLLIRKSPMRSSTPIR